MPRFALVTYFVCRVVVFDDVVGNVDHSVPQLPCYSPRLANMISSCQQRSLTTAKDVWQVLKVFKT